MERVANLLEAWADARGEEERERTRWIAAGHLHDALRDADLNELKEGLGPLAEELPPKVLHGPAVARRLRQAGVADEEFLHALAFHTLGSPEFGNLGMALYAADFLEPGRRLKDDWRRELRRRAPHELDRVVLEILQARIQHLLERGRPLREETVAFWNRMAEGQSWASASEL
jgi:2-amino-4-hydroxy-6-hydroxymethyldihydropteridine diphosphokinase